jgi:hypothetical protein
MRVATRSPSAGNDSEILSAPMLETRFETLVRVSQAVAAHRDPKELFGVLANELHRVVQFDFIGVSFRDKDRNISKLFHRHDESGRAGSRGEANARRDAHLAGLRASCS